MRWTGTERSGAQRIATGREGSGGDATRREERSKRNEGASSSAAQRSAERSGGEESSGTWRVRADRKSLGTWSITPQFSRLAASLRSTEPQRPAAHRSFVVAALPLLPPPPPIPARCTVLVHYCSSSAPRCSTPLRSAQASRRTPRRST